MLLPSLAIATTAVSSVATIAATMTTIGKTLMLTGPVIDKWIEENK